MKEMFQTGPFYHENRFAGNEYSGPYLWRPAIDKLSGYNTDKLVKVRDDPFSSFPRTRESREIHNFWTPAFAGVTASETFYEAIKTKWNFKNGNWNVANFQTKPYPALL